MKTQLQILKMPWEHEKGDEGCIEHKLPHHVKMLRK
jgi:hypothetical protein